MKKSLSCVFVLLVLVLLLCGCDSVEQMGSLPEFSKPYTGEYTCKTLTLGGEDCLDKFEEIKLTLEGDDTFAFTYKTANGTEGNYTGTYSVSPDGENITFSAAKGQRTVSRTFPIEKGAIHVNLTFLGKLLHAEFKFP